MTSADWFTLLDDVVALPPDKVVAVLGTAVHRTPLIVVMENPAGRFALVAIMKGKSTPVAVENVGRNRPSRDIHLRLWAVSMPPKSWLTMLWKE